MGIRFNKKKEVEPPEMDIKAAKEVDKFMKLIPKTEEATVDTFVELSNGKGDDYVE